MRNTRKILVALLLVMTMLVGITVVASAAKTTGDTTLYLAPNANWKVDNARFALYTWDGGDKWFDMKDTNGDGVYECTIPAGIENIIFCRMNPNATDNNWNNKWNQTADLKYNGSDNLYTVKEGTWDKGGGAWSFFEVGECVHSAKDEGTVITPATCTTDGRVTHTCSKCGATYEAALLALGHSYGADGKCHCNAQATFTVAGSIDKSAGAGAADVIVGKAWAPDYAENDMTYNAETKLWSISYTNTTDAEVWLDFKVCLDHSWDKCWGATAAGQTDADNAYVGIPAGYILTISFDNATEKLSMSTAAPHEHNYVNGKCECGEEDPNYVPPCQHEYTYACDKICALCFEETNPNANHNIVAVEAV